MYIPKRYGESKIESCPFCEKRAIARNPQGVPVCLTHKDKEILDIKCACGESLEVMSGKWGPYFRCLRCGNINFRKGLGMSKIDKVPIKVHDPKQGVMLTPEDVDIYFS